MRERALAMGGLALLLAAACSNTAEPPATTPVVTANSVAVTTTTVPPTTSLPTTTVATTTTPVDRLAEVEAIFRDLELRRLDALYREDEEAFAAVFSNDAFLAENLRLLFGRIEFVAEPSAERTSLTVDEVFVDQPGCIAAELRVDNTAATGGEPRTSFVTVTRRPDGGWGLAFSGLGEAWLCTDPHPLES